MKNLKRIFATVLVVLILLTSAPLSGFADTELPNLDIGSIFKKIGESFSNIASAATDGYLTYSVSNGEATITDCDSSASGEMFIPSEIDVQLHIKN